MEWLSTFFGGLFGGVLAFMFSFWFLVFAVLGTVYNDSRNNGATAIFFGILTLISAFGFFNLGALSGIGWATLVVGYIAGGSLFSMWRWFRYTREVVKDFNKRTENMSESDSGFDRIAEKAALDTNWRENKSLISYWFSLWPFAGVTHFAGDLIDGIDKFIRTFLGGIYDQISEKARRDARVDLSKYGS